MGTMFENNKVEMTLGEFLAYRDALNKLEELKEFCMDNRVTWGDKVRRDVSDIGYEVLARFDIPAEVPEEEWTDADRERVSKKAEEKGDK